MKIETITLVYIIKKMAVKSNLKKRLPSRLMKEPFPEDKFEDLLVFGYAARVFDGNDERARYVDQVLTLRI